MASKYSGAPSGAPPAYAQHEGASNLSSPQPAHINPSYPNANFTSRPNEYNQSPYPQHQNQGYGGGPGYYHQPQMGYSQQGPQPQGGYYGPQGGPGYGPQGGYGGGPGYGPGYGGPGYGPQGQYDQRRGGQMGFMEACLGAAACCCCLDACLLF